MCVCVIVPCFGCVLAIVLARDTLGLAEDHSHPLYLILHILSSNEVRCFLLAVTLGCIYGYHIGGQR